MSSNEIIKRQSSDDDLILELGEVLDNENANDLATTLAEARNQNYLHVIIDMQKLEFISSAGVGAILGTVEMFREAGGDIILCNAAENIVHILDVLDIKDYLTVRENQAEAVKTINARK